MAREKCLDAFLTEPPLPLVALVGSRGQHNIITSSFATSEENQHVRYLSLDEDTQILDHAPSIADDNANVVLKRDWLHKHMHVAAAIAALWFTWEADGSRSATILRQIETFRQRCRPSCKIVLVLVQRSGLTGNLPPLTAPAKEDERLGALRKQADLDSRHVLTLVQVEADGEAARFDEASVKRVERSLLELALIYYKDESRNNKKARQLAGKSAPPHLVARHHFKRAYFSEVRRDAASASKHWLACAIALRDVLRLIVSPPTEKQRSSVRLHEVKRVAEFVNRKTTLGAFAGMRAAEACDTFRRHIRQFRPLAHAGACTLSAAALAAAGHVHWSWFCKQYRAFARLLESNAATGGASGGSSLAVVRFGTSGAHPQYAECGYYYQVAASCALERRRCAVRLTAALDSGTAAPAASAVLSLPVNLDVDGDTPDVIAAELGVSCEVSVTADSAIVIELLTRAYEHFKQSRQLRMILFLASQMAEEYFSSQDYEMAKRFFERVAKTYQKERWYTVLARIQHCLRVCARQLSLLNEFVSSSVSLLSARLSTAPEAAATLLKLLALVRIAPPSADLGDLADQRCPPPMSISAPPSSQHPSELRCHQAATSSASLPPLTTDTSPEGLPVFAPLASSVSVDLDGSHSLLCAITWSSQVIQLGEVAILQLRIQSYLATPLNPTALKLVTSDPALSTTLTTLPPDPSYPNKSKSVLPYSGRPGNAGDLADPQLVGSQRAEKPGRIAPQTVERPLCVEAGGDMVLRVLYEPKALGVVSIVGLSLQLGESPSALVLNVPLKAAQLTTDEPSNAPALPPRLTVVAPLPDVSLSLNHPPVVLTLEPTPATVTLATGTDMVERAAVTLVLAPATACVSGGAEAGFAAGIIADGVCSKPLPPPSGGAVVAAPNPAPIIASTTRVQSTSNVAGTPSSKMPAGEERPAVNSTVDVCSSGSSAPLCRGVHLTGPHIVSVDATPAPLTLPFLPPNTSHNAPVTLCTFTSGHLVLTATTSYSPAPGSPPQTVTNRFPFCVAPGLSMTTVLLNSAQQRRGLTCVAETFQAIIRVECLAPPPASIVVHGLTLLPAVPSSGGGDGESIQPRASSPKGAQTRLAGGDAWSNCTISLDADCSAFFELTSNVNTRALGAVAVNFTRADEQQISAQAQALQVLTHEHVRDALMHTTARTRCPRHPCVQSANLLPVPFARA